MRTVEGHKLIPIYHDADVLVAWIDAGNKKKPRLIGTAWYYTQDGGACWPEVLYPRLATRYFIDFDSAPELLDQYWPMVGD